MVPTKQEFIAMFWSLIRFFVVAFITVVLYAGGFDEVDYGAACWAGFVAAAGVLLNFLNPGDSRYGIGESKTDAGVVVNEPPPGG